MVHTAAVFGDRVNTWGDIWNTSLGVLSCFCWGHTHPEKQSILSHFWQVPCRWWKGESLAAWCLVFNPSCSLASIFGWSSWVWDQWWFESVDWDCSDGNDKGWYYILTYWRLKLPSTCGVTVPCPSMPECYLDFNTCKVSLQHLLRNYEWV